MNKSFLHKNYSLSSALELKYAFFFAPKWGISLGVGLSNFAAKGTLNIGGVIPNYDDPAFGLAKSYDLHYQTDNLVEKQQIWALVVPLQFHFEHRVRGRHGISAALGARGYFPIISAQSKFPQGKGSLTTSGYEEFTNAWYTDAPHFGKRDARITPASVKLRPSVDIIADFGGIFSVSHNCDFYLGVYGSYGFMNILPEIDDKKDFITSEPNDGFTVNSLLASNFLSEYNQYVEKNNLDWKTANEEWKRWEVGIKIGVHLYPCVAKKKSMRETKRDFYRSAARNNADRNQVIIKDTVVHATYYIYNTSGNNIGDTNLTVIEKESLRKIINALGGSKILFDIDSDVPKIENKDFIPEVAKVLQEDQSFNLMIEAYTCDLGSERHNRDLALRRAGAIRDLFIQQGVNSSQIQIAGYTANDPESKLNIKNNDREGHRAVIFRILKKQ
jgi:outer membrane protein OmpA-like peptidoglycan-associated protein